MTPRLTIVLPLKGRHLFTLRFLWHANKTRMPYHFLIADGQVHPKLAELLERSHQLFPNLDIEYIRYPDDADFTRFFAKMSDALGRVRTPFAMLADNDDFLAQTGIDRSLDFLEANSDYVCCGGGLAGFSVYSGLRNPNDGLTGSLNRYAYRYTHLDRSEDFSSPSAVERLRRGSRNWWSYYAAYRTDALATICREIVELNFSDLQIHEFFCAMRALTLGKARSDGTTIAYLRQYGTSTQSAFAKDWVHHLLRSRFTSDFTAMIDRIACTAAAADRVDPAPVAEMLRGICEDWLREFLRIYYGSLQTVKQSMRDHAPDFVRWLKKRRRYFVGRERARLLSRLAADGASNACLSAFERELDMIEDVLVGTDFADFIRHYISAFGTADAPAGAPTDMPSAVEQHRCA
jgi:glycosyltransferase domain-containing protein